MAEIDRNDFVCVVDWARLDEADQAWRDWLDTHPLLVLDPANDMLIDTGRTDHGDHRRYWVRASTLEDDAEPPQCVAGLGAMAQLGTRPRRRSSKEDDETS